MNKVHPLLKIVESQKKGIAKGIYSACSANEYVIQSVLERALMGEEYALIEATANQVNQFGGYTGMKPVDFREFVFSIARKISFPLDKLILGGDHLGPLTWQKECTSSAMRKSIELIKQYVTAGFSKIHIDTSMPLGDDKNGLDTATIAERGAILCKASEEAFLELKATDPEVVHLVYVVGSEVPTPGGGQHKDEGIQVTTAKDFQNTMKTFQNTFARYNLEEAWNRVIAVVVQPGVEFGDEFIHEYNREAAKELTVALSKYKNIVFEGHSTDYQTPIALRQMVEDGVAILKVGPALTFALREGLFALSYIENELLKYNAEVEPSNLINILDFAMLKNPENWRKHYHGDAAKIKYSRKYSYSDRCRYYLPVKEVRESVETLINNLKSVKIPLALISQFMPAQYNKIRSGLLKNEPEALLKDRVINCIEDYICAVTSEKQNESFVGV